MPTPVRARRPGRRKSRRPPSARAVAASARKPSLRWGRVALLACVALLLAAGYFVQQLPSVEPLRTANPASTALIDARLADAREHGRAARRNQRWVPLNRISPWLSDAVVNSEDARFYLHGAVDPIELGRAAETALEHGKLGRGASTLTQQLAKNLWLGEERSLLRKAREVLLAHRLESLGKERILELYLNVAEWGDGIYGADAASRFWFKKPAFSLLPEEAAVLAAMLPAPRKRNPWKPSQRLRQRAFAVLQLYQVYHQLTPEAVAQARAALVSLIGAP